MSLFLAFLALLLSFLLPNSAHAANYYVDTSSVGGVCSDSNNGTALTTPWCTIAKALTVMTAGDTINLRTGTYRELASFTATGSASLPITFKSYNSETVHVKGSDLVTNWISLGGIESADNYTTGFESNSLSEFNSSTADSGNTVATDTTVAAHGTYSLKSSYGGTNENARVNKNITSSTDVYARMYFYLDSSFDLNASSSRHDIFLLRESSSVTRARAGIAKDGSGNFYLIVDQLYPSTINIYTGTAGQITKGEWHYIELRYKVDASAGGMTVWLDGTQVASALNTNTSSSFIARIEAGGNSSGSTAPTSGSIMYTDDIKVGSTQNGAFSAKGASTVYQADVNWTVSDVFQNTTRLSPADSLAAITGSGQWYVDTTADLLYVRSTDDSDPDTTTLEVPNRSQVFDISRSSYIVIDGLLLGQTRQSGGACVKIVDSDNITVKNSTVSDNTGSGISLHNSDTNTIYNNQILRNRRQFGGGIRLEAGSDYNTIDSNTITGIGLDGGNGMTLCGDSSCQSNGNDYNTIKNNTMTNFYDTCMYFDTDNDYNTIEKNICHNVHRQSDSQGGNGLHFSLGSDHNVIRNNIVYNTDRHGISIRSDNTSNNYGNKIYNNTVYDTGSTSGSAINIQGTNFNTEVYNNIANTAASEAFNVDANSISSITSDYNLFFNSNGDIVDWGGTIYSNLTFYQRASNQDSHSYFQDADFISKTSSNFKLKNSSLGIDKGTTLGNVADDILSVARPVGGAFDIGAYETGHSHPQTTASNNNTTPTVCTTDRQIDSPQIFKIIRVGNRTRIYFVPPKQLFDRFYIFISPQNKLAQHIAGITMPAKYTSGVLYVDINYLPKAKLTATIQAAGDCSYSKTSTYNF